MITGKFAADFTPFTTAVQQAEAELKSFETDANKVQDSLNRMADAFGGRKVIQYATLMAKAIQEIGGVSRLTERELTRVKIAATEATEKLRLMGKPISADLQRLNQDLA